MSIESKKTWQRAIVIPLILATLVLSAVVSNAQERYTYDNLGQLSQVSYPDGTSISYTYDAAGNILSISTVTTSVATEGEGANGGLHAVVIEQGSSHTVVVKVRTERAGRVQLEVVDVNGLVVSTLESELVADEARFDWDGTGSAGDQQSSGLYLFRLTLHRGAQRVATTTVQGRFVR